jgi:pimeloyl-ACP methyl ester carboxylesterase
VLDEVQRRQAIDGAWRRVRLDAIGFSGHSFGARLTQAIAGEVPPRAARSALERMIDARPRAFIAFSPGFNERDGVDDASLRARFGSINRPFLCVTGTRDDSMIVGDANNTTRRAVYRGLPSGRRAALVLAGADHMTFAGQDGPRRGALADWLLRRAPGAAELEPQHHRVVAAITSDWWRWSLLADGAARVRLGQPAGLAPEDSWQIG